MNQSHEPSHHVERVFIDTNELFPFTVMDVLLTLCENRLFRWVWTDELLAEWEDVIVREHQRSPESARSITAAVRVHFSAGRIDPADYRDRITDDLSPDPGDRAHVAACLGGHVNVLLTRNVKDYRSAALVQHGVRVLTADDYLRALEQRHPIAVLGSFIATANARKRPPVTPHELADRIAAAGAAEFANRIRESCRCQMVLRTVARRDSRSSRGPGRPDFRRPNPRRSQFRRSQFRRSQLCRPRPRRPRPRGQ